MSKNKNTKKKFNLEIYESSARKIKSKGEFLEFLELEFILKNFCLYKYNSDYFLCVEGECIDSNPELSFNITQEEYETLSLLKKTILFPIIGNILHFVVLFIQCFSERMDFKNDKHV